MVPSTGETTMDADRVSTADSEVPEEEQRETAAKPADDSGTDWAGPTDGTDWVGPTDTTDWAGPGGAEA
ncbi:hypothetical protein GCM10010406_18290 [Streptomyces thermolineatus]|uniref:Uncharacterized protein n=2 Tax=Streptomyces thermolineatus TaxID=44033 RepID=A0ABP5YJF0_9ACTN